MIRLGLEDGDCVKIIPMLKKDGSFSPILEFTCFKIGIHLVYDNDKKYLEKALLKKYEHDFSNFYSLRIRRKFCSIYKDGKINFLPIGKEILDILSKDYKFDPRNDLHLKVNIEYKDVKHIPSYENSLIVEKEWKKPDIDINDHNEWIEWIKSNQPYYIEDFIAKNNLLNKMNILKEKGIDISEIISDERDIKLNKILE